MSPSVLCLLAIHGSFYSFTYSGNALLDGGNVNNGTVQFFDPDVKFVNGDFQLLDMLNAVKLNTKYIPILENYFLTNSSQCLSIVP